MRCTDRSDCTRSRCGGACPGAAAVPPPGGRGRASPEFETQTFAYTPPDRAPKGTARPAMSTRRPRSCFERIWAYLEENGLSIASVDPQQRDPRCPISRRSAALYRLRRWSPRWSTARRTRAAKPFSAAKAELRTAKTVNNAATACCASSAWTSA